MIIVPLLAAALAVGAMAGVLALVVLAIHREDRDCLPGRAPTRATAAARHLMGLRVSGADVPAASKNAAAGTRGMRTAGTSGTGRR